MWKNRENNNILDDVAYLQVKDLSKKRKMRKFLFSMVGHLLQIQI